MSHNRKPSKATPDEIREFYTKTKDIISKNGMYYDSITKKYKKALKQDGKSKGSGRPLVADGKYSSFLKRLSEDERGDMTSLEQRAREKGFSQLQKERKLFGKAGAGAVAADVVAQGEVMKKAEEAQGKPPTNVVKTKKLKGKIKLQKMKTAGETKDETAIAQTQLKKRGGSKLGKVEIGSEAWYAQQVMKARHDAERNGEAGEEGMKTWRREQQKKYGLNPNAKKGEIMIAAQMHKDEMEGRKEEHLKKVAEGHQKHEEKAKQAESRGVQSGNLRKEKREEGAEEQKEQADKIEEVIVDNDKSSDKPLHDLGNVEQEIDHKEEPIYPQRGDGMEEVKGNADWEEREGAAPLPPKSFRGRKGQEFYQGETKTEGMGESPPIPVPQTESNVRMEITDKPDLEVEIDKSPNEGIGGMGQSFISPASEKVSMERNRMKYSPKRLYEECRSFVKIYSDDIKTPSWKKLMEQFSKMSEKTPVVALRKIHRELEEEVIEYYQGRKGLRLGVIIDPSVLGINVAALQGMMNPQMPMAMGNQVREVGTQQRRVKTKDIHYHLGGRQHATDAILPEGENIENHEKDKRHIKGRVKVPIQGRQNWLLKRSGRSKIPKNLKIR